MTKISQIIHFVLVELTCLVVMLPGIIQTIINYFILDLDNESYALTYPLMYDSKLFFFKMWYQMFDLIKNFAFLVFFLPLCRLPFNWKTPFGYVVASSFFYGTTSTIAISIAPIISLGIGFCQFIIFFINENTRDVHVCNDFAKNAVANPTKMKKQFCTLIQNYCCVKELSETMQN